LIFVPPRKASDQAQFDKDTPSLARLAVNSPFIRVKRILCSFRKESGAADFNEKLGGREWDLDFVGHGRIIKEILKE